MSTPQAKGTTLNNGLPTHHCLTGLCFRWRTPVPKLTQARNLESYFLPPAPVRG